MQPSSAYCGEQGACKDESRLVWTLFMYLSDVELRRQTNGIGDASDAYSAERYAQVLFAHTTHEHTCGIHGQIATCMGLHVPVTESAGGGRTGGHRARTALCGGASHCGVWPTTTLRPQ